MVEAFARHSATWTFTWRDRIGNCEEEYLSMRCDKHNEYNCLDCNDAFTKVRVAGKFRKDGTWVGDREEILVAIHGKDGVKILMPFDLAKAKAGEPLCTRSGDEVKFLMHIPEAQAGCRLMLLREKDSTVICQYENGRRMLANDNDRDIFMAPKPPRTCSKLLVMIERVWMHSPGEKYITSVSVPERDIERFKQRFALRNHNGSKIIGIKRVSVTEGQFDA
jgi:hypothetical protein